MQLSDTVRERTAWLTRKIDLLDQAAYIASWLKVLKNDKRAIFTAASHAQRAAAFLNGLQPVPQAEAAE